MDQKPLGWQVSRPQVSWVHEAELKIPDLGGMDSHSGGKDTAAVAASIGKVTCQTRSRLQRSHGGLLWLLLVWAVMFPALFLVFPRLPILESTGSCSPLDTMGTGQALLFWGPQGDPARGPSLLLTPRQKHFLGSLRACSFPSGLSGELA